MPGTRFPVSDGVYIQIDRRMSELKGLLSDPTGSFVDPDEVLDWLQTRIERKVEPKLTPDGLQHLRSLTLVQASVFDDVDTVTRRAFSAIARHHPWARTLGDLELIDQADLDDTRNLGAKGRDALAKYMQSVGLSLADPTLDRTSWYTIEGSLLPAELLFSRLIGPTYNALHRAHFWYTRSAPLESEDITTLGELGLLRLGDLFNTNSKQVEAWLQSSGSERANSISLALRMMMQELSKTGSW